MDSKLSSQLVAISEFRDNINKSVLRDIGLGRLVELLVDGKFFIRTDNLSERYAGYVSLITNNTIGLSATHPENERHGYVGDGRTNDKKQEIVEIETRRIIKYRIL